MTTESQPIRERKVTICPVFFVSVLLPFYSCPGPLYLTWGDKSSTKAHKGDLGLSVVFYLSNLQHLSSLTKVGGAEEKAAAHRRRLGRKPGDEGGRGRQRSFFKKRCSSRPHFVFSTQKRHLSSDWVCSHVFAVQQHLTEGAD